MMEVQNQKGECSNEIEFYFRPAQHLLMDISCGGSGVCGLSGDQGAQKIHKVGAGVSRQAVSKWESGASAPSTTNLMALAKVFDVSAEELLKETQKN